MARATQSLGLLKHRPSIHRADERVPDLLSALEETTGPETTGPETTGPETGGLETSGLETSGLETSGPETTGPETSGLETSGLETSGLETTGPETSGLETNSLEPLRAGRQAEEAVSDPLKRPQVRSAITTREVARDGGECQALTH